VKKSYLFFLLFLISISVLAKPKIGLVGDNDFIIADCLYDAGVSFLPLSLSDLEPEILDFLDVLIIHETPKLDKILVKNLKRYLRSGKKAVVFAGVLANDLINGTLAEDSIAYTLGITDIQAYYNLRLPLEKDSLELPLAYGLNQRKGNELAVFDNKSVAISMNDKALVWGISSLDESLAKNNCLKKLFCQTLKEFLLDKTMLEEAQKLVSVDKLPPDKIDLYNEAAKLKEELDLMELGQAFDNFDRSLSLFKDCYLYSLPSRTQETRAMWFRPPTSKSAITDSLDRLAELGINLIFVETLWEGMLLYPNGPISQRPEFRGFDPLEFIITEAHKRNIEVHAWLEVFFSGYKRLGEILEKHPNWAAVDIYGNVPVKAEDDKYFIDPAHKEARKFLINTFVDMVERYDLDGLHLDYIRYPLQTEVPYGFSSYSKELFTQTTGLEVPKNSTDKNWQAFNIFKEEQVTTFVKELREAVLLVKPLLISAAVFPGNDGIVNKNQNWPLWIEEGYLDFLTPMLYSRSTSLVEHWIQDLIEEIGPKIPFYPALAAISIPEGDLLVEQTMLIQKYNLDGVAFFAWNHFNDELFDCLIKGPFRSRANRQ
jgi:uncharacterized lipoprotein YddW (UPF0748 family)